jgi:hypothetical protein
VEAVMTADDLADIDATLDYWRGQPELRKRMEAIAIELHSTLGWSPIRRAMIERMVERDLPRVRNRRIA